MDYTRILESTHVLPAVNGGGKFFCRGVDGSGKRLLAEPLLRPAVIVAETRMAMKSRRRPARKKARKKGNAKTGRRWSQHVTGTSNAMDLEEGIFTHKDPKRIALSLKRSAEHSRRRKSEPYRSAMSMLTFYINRAGKDLPAAQRMRLETAKDELRKAFGRQ
jgi:hypothetical protein